MPSRLEALTRDLLAIGRREAGEVAARFPKVQRRVGGYNLDALAPDREINLAHFSSGPKARWHCRPRSSSNYRR